MSDIMLVILVGRIASEPILKIVSEKCKLTSFAVAINRFVQDRHYCTFVQCVAWNRVAEIICSHLHKGSRVLIKGDIDNQKRKNKEGKEYWNQQVRVLEVNFLDPMPRDETQTQENSSLLPESEAERREPGDEQQAPPLAEKYAEESPMDDPKKGKITVEF